MMKDSIYSLITRMITAVGKFVGFVIIANKLSVENYGLFTLSFTLAFIFSITILLGYHNAILNINSRFTRNRQLIHDTTIYFTFFISIISIIVVFSLIMLFTKDYKFSFSIAVLTCSQIIYLNGYNMLIANSSISLLMMSNTIIYSIFMLLITFSNSTDYLIYNLYYSLSTLTIVIFILKKPSFNHGYRNIKRIIKIQIAYGIKHLSFEINNIIHNRFDVIIIKLFFGDYFLGIYSMIKNIHEGLMYLPKAIAPIIIKEGSRKNKIPYKSIVLKFTIIYLLIILLFIFFGKNIISLTYGTKYLTGYIPLIIVLIGGYFYSISFLLSNFFIGKGIFKIGIVGSVLTSVSIILLNLLLTSKFALYGAAISYLLASIIFTIYATINTVKVKELLIKDN